MFKLTTKVQNYDWGKLGSESKAAQLWNAGEEIKATEPYAELWIGTHPNGPSYIDPQTPLKSIINAQTCSKEVFEKYNDLPFLFKVLSIRKALSIQAHPDKALAAKLHKEFPNIYKDPNHKPEMAVALTEFEAFIGFRPLQEIVHFLNEYAEFRHVTGAAATEFINVAQDATATDASKKAALKTLFSALQNANPELVASSITEMIARIGKKGKEANAHDLLLVRLNEQYPQDVGTFCANMLNYVALKPGEAIFLAANEPHAYLSGDCVECMAASDNVVRSGLTPKFKDVKTLVEMLTYNFGTAEAQILRGDKYLDLKFTREYNPPIEEFSILQTTLANVTEMIKGMAGPGIMITTSGKGTCTVGSETVALAPGSVHFIPAMTDVTLTGTETDPLVVYRAFCTL